MTLQEIKDAVDAGEDVCWSNFAYKVVKDNIGQYLIKFIPNNHCIGLTWKDGVTLNGKEDEFFIYEDEELDEEP